jgi:hypothetical protein
LQALPTSCCAAGGTRLFLPSKIFKCGNAPSGRIQSNFAENHMEFPKKKRENHFAIAE